MRALASLIILAGTVLGQELATLVAASGLARSSPGTPWAMVGGTALYLPWKWIEWLGAFGSNPPPVFRAVQLIGWGSPFVALALAMALTARQRKLPESTSHGDARWATPAEIENSGLGDDGVVIGQTEEAEFAERKTTTGEIEWVFKAGGRILCDNSLAHCLIFAPSRSGKGISMINPTLLTWRHSVVVYDIKGELWRDTAGWRSQFSHCLRFAPTDPRGAVRFNPLFCIRKGEVEGEVRDAQILADVCGDPEGSKESEDYWQQSAKPLLVAAILHVLYAEPRKSLAGVLEFLSGPEGGQEQVLRTMRDTLHLGWRAHPTIFSTASEFLGKKPNDRSGVFSTVLTALAIYRDPIVARNTDVSDFSIEQLTGLDRPVSLYILVPPADAAKRLRPLVRVCLNMIGMRLTEDMAGLRRFHATRWFDRIWPWRKAGAAKSTQRLLYLLDEFPSLGRVPFLQSNQAYVAGYGIKLFLVCTSLNQLEQFYGPSHSFLENSNLRVTYHCNDDRTAKRVSDMLGTRTVVRRQITRSRSATALFASQITETFTENALPLMRPERLMHLPYDRAILLMGGRRPAFIKKLMYYQDPRFAARRELPLPNPRAELPTKPDVPWTKRPSGRQRPNPWLAMPVEEPSDQSVDPDVRDDASDAEAVQHTAAHHWDAGDGAGAQCDDERLLPLAKELFGGKAGADVTGSPVTDREEGRGVPV